MFIVVLGQRGMGKSTQIRARLSNLSRALVFDTLAEFGTSGEVIRDELRLVQQLREREHTHFRFIYQPLQTNLDHAIELICDCANAVGDLWLVIDEIDQIASAAFTPESLAWLTRYGRHRNVSLMVACRRAAEMPRLITSQADTVISFRQQEPLDIDYLRKRVSSEFAEQTTTLNPYYYLMYDPTSHLVNGPFESNEVTVS